MANRVNIDEKKVTKIFRRLIQIQASPLYYACRAGDVNRVRELLSSLKYSDINRLEPNGSTALHAASFFGHADVVRLLLHERGVMRHRRNRHGITAFQEAANDEIRQLFIRPRDVSKRFCNDNDTNNTQQLLTVVRGNKQNANDDSDDDDPPPRGWIDAVADEKTIEGTQITLAVAKSLFGSRFTRSFTFAALNHLSHESFSSYENEKSVRDFLQRLVDEHVTPHHPQYDKACELLTKFAQTKRIEPLLRLYTLETPLYRQLPNESDAWLLPLICHFANLKSRFFQGTSYRGLSMTHQQLKSYQWALNKPSSIIKINTFCSTSIDRDVAEEFSTLSSNGDKISVFMIFEFPHLCDGAIQLYAISDKLPCLSDFEDEREVLLLPNTLFHVKRIDNIEDQQYTTIWLEHVPLEKHPIRTLLQCMAKDIRKE